MFSEALAYPRQGDDWLKRIGIGGVLYILSFLILPMFVLQGYFYRVMGDTIRGGETPPAWDEWVELLVEGLKMWVIQLAYGIVPAMLIVIGTVFSALRGGMGAVGVVFTLVGALLYLVVAYVLPAAMANFAYTESFGAAFDLGTVGSAAMSGDYFVAILLAFVGGIVLGVIGAFLSVILVGIFVFFYAQVAIYYLVARGFADAVGVTSSV